MKSVWIIILLLSATQPLLSFELPKQVIESNEMVNRIDRLQSTLKLKEVEVYTGTDRGGSLRAYSDGQNLKKIELVVGLSNRDFHYIYYFSESAVCCFVKKESFFKWDEASGKFNLEKFLVEKQTSYFYKGGKIFFVLATQLKDEVETNESQEETQFITDLLKALFQGIESGHKKLDLEKFVK